ncbi:hypothetical protein GUITHDRAFT_147500 [Guillardia theta CCMP2712]|uniref:Uncharacterized protein n=1 Tax=Guillardia theta (strain CCMP2712) TaxID=905079 RepID=L1ID66_GUITC|nr:hypothetical protein GUITHDRAFT_147500 [Guillardia theta CCMP2712]EKX34042.1 hypothetical protein GUITHDRAFT_147500 [Guillardia theta CCMP2712]|eukprot:XP_005821022.1 hypothetical protein GUITHDRAFT_147500 [Guillardia theta CCMP2712]
MEDSQDVCENFTLIVDDGGEGEYQIDVSIPSCLSKEEKERVMLEIFESEQLPEWRRHSFLVIASKLLNRSGRESKAGHELGAERAEINQAAAAAAAAGQGEEEQKDGLLLSPEDVPALVDKMTSVYGMSFVNSSYQCRISIAKEEIQVSPIERFSMLMREASTSKPVLDLMRVFWEDGMALASRRMEIMEGCEKEYEREHQSIVLRGAFMHEDEVNKQLEALKTRYREKKKLAGKEYRKSLSKMQEVQRNDFSSYMNVIQRESVEETKGGMKKEATNPASPNEGEILTAHEDPMDAWNEVFGGGEKGAGREEEETSKGLWSMYGRLASTKASRPRGAIDLVSWVGTNQLRKKGRILEYCTGPPSGGKRRTEAVMRGIAGDNLLGLVIPIAHPSSSATRRKETTFLDVGQWCSTWHTNLVAAHVAFHLVVESVPHPVNPDSRVSAGLRSVVQAAARHSVTGLAVPLLLTETSAEASPAFAEGLSGSAEMEGNLSRNEKLMIRSTAVMRCLWEEIRGLYAG